MFWYWSSFHRVVRSKTRSRERLKSRYSRGLGRSVSYPVCVLDTIHKASLVLFDFLGFRNSWLTKHVWKQNSQVRLNWWSSLLLLRFHIRILMSGCRRLKDKRLNDLNAWLVLLRYLNDSHCFKIAKEISLSSW